MNVRFTILIVAVLVIAGGTYLAVTLTQSRTANPDPPYMYRIDESVMTHIAVTYDGKRFDYDRKPGGATWYIQEDPEVPVFVHRWSGMPLILSGPRVNRVLSGSIDDAAAYGLDPPQTRVEVTQRGGHSLEFHLGYATPDNRNQYARLVGNPTLFTVALSWGNEINRLVTEPPYPQLYHLEEEKLIYVEVSSGGETTEYVRRYRDGSFKWLAVEGEEEVLGPQDPWQTLPGLLAYPRAYNVLSNKLEDPESYGLEPPKTTVRVGREAEGITEFYLGDLTPDGSNRYGRVQDDDRLFAVPVEWTDQVISLAAGT